MPLIESTLTPSLVQEIKETFDRPDFSLIKSIIYFDGWVDWEENGGILIFKAIDDTLQMVTYGYCVMSEDHSNPFILQEVTLSEAEFEISEMEKQINQQSIS